MRVVQGVDFRRIGILAQPCQLGGLLSLGKLLNLSVVCLKNSDYGRAHPKGVE